MAPTPSKTSGSGSSVKTEPGLLSAAQESLALLALNYLDGLDPDVLAAVQQAKFAPKAKEVGDDDDSLPPSLPPDIHDQDDVAEDAAMGKRYLLFKQERREQEEQQHCAATSHRRDQSFGSIGAG